MDTKMKRIFYYTLATISLLILTSCFGPPKTVPPITGPIVWLNRPADFPLPSFKGKITLILFITEKCPACITMQSALQEILKKQGDRVQILGIYTPIARQKTTVAEIKKFLKEHNIVYPVLYDSNSKILRAFHVVNWPTLVVSNANTEIVEHMHGMQNADKINQAILKATQQTKN